MSAQKTISLLSFSVIALFITAIPSFAQTTSVAAPTEQPSAASLNSAEQIAAVNKARRTASYRSESEVVADTKSSQKQEAFSATKFMQALTESRSSSSTPTIVLNNFDTTEFDVEKPASSKRITFVPSKGQSSIPQ